jgi:hypothetical protein
MVFDGLMEKLAVARPGRIASWEEFGINFLVTEHYFLRRVAR